MLAYRDLTWNRLLWMRLAVDGGKQQGDYAIDPKEWQRSLFQIAAQGRGTALRSRSALCLMSLTCTRPRRLALEPRCIGVAPSRPKLRTNFVTRGPSTSLTSCRWQTFTPPLSALPMSSAG